MADGMGSYLNRIGGWLGKSTGLRGRLNQYMRTRYTANLLAGITAAVCGILAAIALFLPNCLGMGNDSIANEKMGYYRLDYLNEAEDGGSEPTNAYFTRVYEQTSLSRGTEFSLENALVNLAKALDWLFTRDQLFDIRFLAFLYMALYLPGVFLILKAALERVRNFTEAVILAVAGGLIFSDISYIAYFNSLYSDALFFIFLLYMAGGMLLMHKEGKGRDLFAILAGIACMGFSLVSRRGFLAGIVLAFFFLMHLRHAAGNRQKILSIVVTCFVLAASVLSFFQVNSEFDDTAKYHAMTRGVLLQSTNPARALENMGINVSYSVLADDSLYENYPVTELANPAIREGFLDSYTQRDIALFYVSHPGALLSMWDLGIKASMELRRDYCGNYEKSAGMPPMGKSLFCSVWSIFKEQSAPKTIGYPLALLLVVFATTGRSLLGKRAKVQRWNYTYFMACICLGVLGLADMTYVVMNSGDAQLVQYNIVLGAVMDILLYFVMAEILHKLNVLEDESGEHQS